MLSVSARPTSLPTPEVLADLREAAERWGLPVETLVGRLALRIDEVAHALGVHRRTVEEWVARDVFPGAWTERKVTRIPVLDVLRFMESRRRREAQGTRLRDRARRFLEGGELDRARRG